MASLPRRWVAIVRLFIAGGILAHQPAAVERVLGGRYRLDANRVWTVSSAGLLIRVTFINDVTVFERKRLK
jgi:hypothetical protein